MSVPEQRASRRLDQDNTTHRRRTNPEENVFVSLLTCMDDSDCVIDGRPITRRRLVLQQPSSVVK